MIAPRSRLRHGDRWLALRSLFWAVALPGVVAGYVPWRFLGLRHAVSDLRDPLHALALAGIVTGAGLLAACILHFARTGRGTLSPLDPPRVLVVRGPYRHVRNPMYLGVTLVLLGEVLLLRSAAVLVYFTAWLVAVNLFVIGYEEPLLRRRFGADYENYFQATGRWLPRMRRRRRPGSR
ncbi:MAG: isoprenylcysteine carboxylmethyltransferase family protein [Acidobacteria bacterium]|nr:isoprenylcysteine carboxylmethyltransferase family protein [Acidobacteriota bacterium]